MACIRSASLWNDPRLAERQEYFGPQAPKSLLANPWADGQLFGEKVIVERAVQIMWTFEARGAIASDSEVWPAEPGSTLPFNRE